MSRSTFNIPDLGEGIKGGDVLNVLVKVGDTVAEDQGVLELETDKATIEVPSSVAGTVTEIKVKAGDKVTVGQACSSSSGRRRRAARASAPREGQRRRRPRPPRASAARPATPSRRAADRVSSSTSRAARGLPPPRRRPRPPAAPDTRPVGARGAVGPPPRAGARARHPHVTGTGPGGRISADDVLAHGKHVIASQSSGGGALPAVVLPDFSKWGAIERQPMRAIRRKTAEHMVNSWAGVPHVTQHEKADVTDLEALRQKFGKRLEAQRRAS